MKLEELKRRLDKRRPMTAISMRFPADVIEDLKRVAPLRGFTGYQPLIRAYVGQGLREDLEQLEEDPVAVLVENLKRRGVSETVIEAALTEAARKSSMKASGPLSDSCERPPRAQRFGQGPRKQRPHRQRP